LTAPARAPFGRYRWAVTAVALATLLAACSSGSPQTVSGPIGTSVGVSLSSSTGGTSVQQGGTITFTATVTSDPTNAGVTWALSGQGQLINATSKSVTYQAPTGITGTTSPILTATSIADSTKNAGTLLVVLGTPLLNATTLFPGNLNIIYSAQLSVAGGLAPYVWAISSGALPPGVVLAASTISFDTIGGTPTAEGVYPFQVKVTDANHAVTSVDLTLVIKAATACVIEGQYAAVYSGYVNGALTVGAGSLNISSTGAITGYHDFNTPGTTNVAETTSGTCQTRTANNGLLTLSGQLNSPTYNFAITTGLLNGRIQLVNGGDAQAGTGPLEKQEPADFALTKLAGDFAFGAIGAFAGNARGGLAGNLSIDMGGVVTGGYVDSNDASPMTDAPLAGTLSNPDANGHGTMTLTATVSSGTRTLHFSYYIVNANRVFIASTDTGVYVSGFMTRRSAAFDNSALVNAGIVNLWGALPVFTPRSVIALGRLSGANATAGTINLLLDTSSQSTNTYSQAVNGAHYAVRADGRTTLTATSGGTTRNFVLYLGGAPTAYTGYLIETGSASGNAGILEQQSPGPFSTTVPGLFVSGIQYAQDEAPMVLMPAVHMSEGAFTASYSNGYFTMDTTTGRGVGALTISGIGVGTYTFYTVRPDKVLALRMGTQFTSAGLSWMVSD